MKICKFVPGLLASSILAAPAFAQAPAEAAPPAEEATGSDEIVVTAQRRDARYVDVPASITVVTGEQLEAAGVSGTRDLQLLTPGLNISQQGTFVQPTIRGVGTSVTGTGADPNVAVYVDGVYMASQGAALFDFNSVSQIEVLKGPQGTLYGRNATGGAIVVSTKVPSLTENSGSVEIGYGRFDEVRANAFANVVLNDAMAFNISLYNRSNDGYVTNVFNGQDAAVTKSRGVRGRLLFQATDNLRFILTGGHVNQEDNTAYSYSPLNGNSIFPNSQAAQLGLTDRRRISLNAQPYNELRLTTASLNIEWDGNWGKLSSVSAYARTSFPFLTDLDGTEIDLQVFGGDPQTTKTWSQEVIYTSPRIGPVSFTGGLFYLKEKSHTQALITSFGAVVFPPDVFAQADAFAVFLEGTLDITDSLHLTAGGRYSTEKKEVQTFFGSGGPQVVDASKRFSDFTPQASLRYDLSPESSIYVAYSEGFKSGLFDGGNLGNCPVVGPTCPFEGTPVEPEKVKSYEAGFKYNSGGTIMSLTGYYTDYKNIQVNALGTNALGIPNQQILYNAAAAEIYGVEAELSMRVSDFFRFSSGAAWTHSEYTDFPLATKWTPRLDAQGNPVGGNVLDPNPSATGNELIRTPEFTAFVSGTFTHELPKGSLQANVTASYSDSFFWHVNNRIKQPSFVVVNASASWIVSDRLKLTIWGENLTDERRLVYPREANVGDFTSYSKPISYGFSIGYEY
jgi:iron complex outermembrane receptor protein